MGPILLSVVLAAIPVVLWRIHATVPAPWLAWTAGALALLAILLGLAIGLRRNMAGQSGTPRRVGALSALAAAVALLGSWEALWPCAVGCSRGAAYARLLGLDAAILAGIVLAVIALITLIQAHRTRINPVAELLAWACVGSSAYFLFLSAHLGLLCSHCLAVHGVILCLPAALLAGSSLRALERLAVVVVAALALHAWYHPVGATDRPIAIEGELDAADVRLLSRADLGRRFGDPHAPLRLELAIGMHCPLCAEHLPALFAALEPALRRGDLHLVVRHADVTRRDGRFGRLTMLAVAAAAEGRYREFLRAHLGAPLETDPAAIDARLGPEWERLGELTQAYRTPLELLLAADQQQLIYLSLGGTPSATLFRRGTRDPIGTWRRDFDPTLVATAVAAAVPLEL